MEIIKGPLPDGVVKLCIGASYNENFNEVSGTVELDIENQAYFVDSVSGLFDEGKVELVVDMGNVTYIDSSGLWALFEGHKKAVQKNGQLVLFHVTKDVKRVLDITKMSTKLAVCETEEDALATFR
jgi:anti-sigma B factor antagonist